jgi:hypothetical protein
MANHNVLTCQKGHYIALISYKQMLNFFKAMLPCSKEQRLGIDDVPEKLNYEKYLGLNA